MTFLVALSTGKPIRRASLQRCGRPDTDWWDLGDDGQWSCREAEGWGRLYADPNWTREDYNATDWEVRHAL
jgi:hypothetical protein